METERSEEEKTLEKKEITSTKISKKVASAGIFIVVGLILSYLNPFAYFTLFGTKINPFAYIVNAITGVLLGLSFSVITAFGIALLRFSLGIGSIHAFHGGVGGAIVVGTIARLIWNRKSEFVKYAALTEPIGTIFLGGTIAQIIAPLGGFEGLYVYWGLFAASCIPGSIIGFIVLKFLESSNITRKDYD
ncbi:MAG: energy coupling factor transporter S component ThiW [Promethearchaeia archaeon]